MPAGCKKTANIRLRRVSDDEKKKRQKELLKLWQKRKYTYSRCNKTITNGSTYQHDKSCKNI